MKRILLTLVLGLGLLTANTQNISCDSLNMNIELTTDVTTPWSMIYYLNGTLTFQGNINNHTWTLLNINVLPLCASWYYGNDIAVTLPTNIYDTLELCWTVFDNFIDCTICDTLVFQGDFWTSISPSTPLLIEEFKTNSFSDNKNYDLLGREVTDIALGSIYIRNNKKYIRVK